MMDGISFQRKASMDMASLHHRNIVLFSGSNSCSSFHNIYMCIIVFFSFIVRTLELPVFEKSPKFWWFFCECGKNITHATSSLSTSSSSFSFLFTFLYIETKYKEIALPHCCWHNEFREICIFFPKPSRIFAANLNDRWMLSFKSFLLNRIHLKSFTCFVLETRPAGV